MQLLIERPKNKIKKIMDNPFELILNELVELRNAINNIKITAPTPQATEIIDRKELLKRLDITEPTAIRYGKLGIIPEIHIGSTIRYNWPSVIHALENKKVK